MVQKTAMQELINSIQESIDHPQTIDKQKYVLISIKLFAEALLEKEKEQFVHFFKWFRDKGESYIGMSIEQLVEEYYNQKTPELLHKDGTPMRKVKLGKEAQELLDEAINEINQNK
jgi:hypothetical protein